METSLPIFVSPAAMAGLGHPEGEKNIARGAGKAGIIQAVRKRDTGFRFYLAYLRSTSLCWYFRQISSNASCTVEEIADVRSEGQPLIFQVRRPFFLDLPVSTGSLTQLFLLVLVALHCQGAEKFRGKAQRD